MERAKGFEPSTPTLARLCSTPELRPHSDQAARSRRVRFRMQAPKIRRLPPTRHHRYRPPQTQAGKPGCSRIGESPQPAPPEKTSSAKFGQALSWTLAIFHKRWGGVGRV